IPRLQDVNVVLEEPFLIQIRLVDLALGSVLFDEPVVAKRLRILLFGDPHDLGCLRFESLQLTWPDLQVGVQFQMAHNSSSIALRDVASTEDSLARRHREASIAFASFWRAALQIVSTSSAESRVSGLKNV